MGLKLTPAQREIIGLHADGLRLKQIADRRGTTMKTIEYQLREARARNGAKTQYHLIALYVREVECCK